MCWQLHKLVLLVLLTLFSSGSTLECYTCSSHNGPFGGNACERFNVYDYYQRSTCLPGDQVCAKFIVSHDGMTWVHRSCRPHDICEYLRNTYSNSRDHLLECSTCSDRNLCNSAVLIKGGLLVVIIAVYQLVY